MSQIFVSGLHHFFPENTVFLNGLQFFDSIATSREPIRGIEAAISAVFDCAKKCTRKNFPQHAFFTRSVKIKTLCFQRFMFGLPRANNRNCRREDSPRIPIGD